MTSSWNSCEIAALRVLKPPTPYIVSEGFRMMSLLGFVSTRDLYPDSGCRSSSDSISRCRVGCLKIFSAPVSSICLQHYTSWTKAAYYSTNKYFTCIAEWHPWLSPDSSAGYHVCHRGYSTSSTVLSTYIGCNTKPRAVSCIGARYQKSMGAVLMMGFMWNHKYFCGNTFHRRFSTGQVGN